MTTAGGPLRAATDKLGTSYKPLTMPARLVSMKPQQHNYDELTVNVSTL